MAAVITSAFLSRQIKMLIAICCSSWLVGLPLMAVGAQHPLDALDAEEISASVNLLRAAGQVDDKTLFLSLTLEEPPKQQVLAWKPGEPIPRAARVVLRRGNETREAVVNLTEKKIGPTRTIKEGQAALAMSEFLGAIDTAVSDPKVQEALQRRGITDFKKLACVPRTVGNFGREEEGTRRLVKVDCFDLSKEETNTLATPIEGLYIKVDVDEKKVLEIIDIGVVPIPPGVYPLGAAAQSKLRERKLVQMSSSQGQKFTVDGSLVSWENWRFHMRWDVRAGLILSVVTYNDQGKPRNILYQGYVAEMFVPYQDPSEGWYYRNYLDEGDYGMGTMGSRLIAGADCPKEAVFLSPVMANPTGGADTLENYICIFERATGEPTWRHFDMFSHALDSRPDVELIVRFIATVGNYDYLFDWIFDSKGSLTFRGGATGLDAVKGVKAQHLKDATAQSDTAWGPLIAPGRAGINHDHYFSLRLDVDVDGPKNRFVRERLVTETQPQGSPRTAVWRVQPEVAKKDSEAKFRLSYEHPSLWRVQSLEKTNTLGYPTSYVLRPGTNALPLVGEQDSPMARASFANYHLWITPYAAEERYPTGEYPNQSAPGQGLPAWTKKGRNLDGEDIVLWYTVGFHHVPAAEDWPAYNVGWHTVTLAPYNFFDQNPAMDLPPQAE
jgi:primary-amine oxidase